MEIRSGILGGIGADERPDTITEGNRINSRLLFLCKIPQLSMQSILPIARYVVAGL